MASTDKTPLETLRDYLAANDKTPRRRETTEILTEAIAEVVRLQQERDELQRLLVSSGNTLAVERAEVVRLRHERDLAQRLYKEAKGIESHEDDCYCNACWKLVARG